MCNGLPRATGQGHSWVLPLHIRSNMHVETPLTALRRTHVQAVHSVL